MNTTVNPNYDGMSIVNLASSILLRYNVHSEYPPLDVLPQEILSSSTNFIFFVIDGLGYQFLQTYGQETIFHEYTRGKITSVFPSTTAAAMMAYYTGQAPKNHGIPAWYTYLRQIGMISTILPFTPRSFSHSLTEEGIQAEDIYQFHSLFDHIEVPQTMLLPKGLQDAPFSKILAKNRKLVGFTALDDLFLQLNQIIHENQGKSNFIFVYWPHLDAIAHEYGINSQQAQTHLHELNGYFKQYVPVWKAQDPFTRLIISADHGLIDIPEDHCLNVEQFPDLYHSLILPLAGEGRAPFFYVRSDQLNSFKQFISSNLQSMGKLYSRQQLLENNLMGYFEFHPELPFRLGDYVFIFEDSYILRDTLMGEKKHDMVGYHGGLSPEEMYVPLIVI